MDGLPSKHPGPAKSGSKFSGMPVTVTRLRRAGRRVTRQEREEAEPLLGRIIISASPPSNFTVYRSSAYLMRPGLGEPGHVGTPLFEPVIIHLDERGLVISGYEIQTEGNVSVQYVQVWLVKPLTPAQR